VSDPVRTSGSNIDIVQDLYRDLGATSDVGGVGAAAVRWARAALGTGSAVALSRPDAAGRLRVSWSRGEGLEAGRERAARRRAVFETREPVRRSSGYLGRALAVLPLVAGDEAIGVLEVAAPRRAIDREWQAIQTIAGHVAFALRTLAERDGLRREADALERAAILGRDLVRTRSSVAAVRVAVGFVAERLQVPVAGWCEGPDGALKLAGVQGLGTRKRREVRRVLSRLPRWSSLPIEERRSTEGRFAELAGVRAVSSLDVGGGVLMAGNPRHGLQASLEVVGALLAEVLRLRSVATVAELRKEHLDMGIAWAAHELRGPLLGVRAVLELMLQREVMGRSDHEILQRSLRELDHLAGTAEALLTWAGGSRPLRLRRTDLVRVAWEAVESCRLETGGDGAVLRAPGQVFARVDGETVRAALANLVRNAMAYANPGTVVEVGVEQDDGRVLVSVRDRGPMILEGEREAIFDPFVRGSTAVGGRHGTGLGLFIARRIVEAHHGRLWVESAPEETTFLLVLPSGQGGERRVAS
jgi:signal transduction histidine kinase